MSSAFGGSSSATTKGELVMMEAAPPEPNLVNMFLGSFTGFTYTLYALMAQEKGNLCACVFGCFWLFNLENKTEVRISIQYINLHIV